MKGQKQNKTKQTELKSPKAILNTEIGGSEELDRMGAPLEAEKRILVHRSHFAFLSTHCMPLQYHLAVRMTDAQKTIVQKRESL